MKFPQQWFSQLAGHLDRMKATSGDVESAYQPALIGEQITVLAQAVKPETLPRVYQKFLEQGSSGIDYHFNWQPEGAEEAISGGARLFMADKLVADLQSCKEWATDTWIADSEEDRELWLNGLPFAALANGDYLALDLRPKVDDPPVLYLSHDDASSEIAPSLTAFLSAWERLGYIGPESWVLEPYLNEQGHLSAEGEAAQELRRQLGIPE